jgi:hypothetical protein
MRGERIGAAFFLSWAVPLAVASGCIPSRLPVRRGETGSVADAKSGQPIVGATVLVESWQVLTPTGERSKRKDVFLTATDSDGRFEVPELREWYLVIPIPDLPPAFNRRFCVTKDGYKPAVADPWADAAQSPWSYHPHDPLLMAAMDSVSPGRAVCPFGTSE